VDRLHVCDLVLGAQDVFESIEAFALENLNSLHLIEGNKGTRVIDNEAFYDIAWLVSCINVSEEFITL
jgi:hypothetical protein